MRDTITVILSALAIATVLYVIVSDVWFHDTLMGRAIAILIIAMTYYAVFVAGVCQGIKMTESQGADYEGN